MAANIHSMSPVMEESFFADEMDRKDLRTLSAAIMAATERAELVAHETDRWLTGHQEFENLDTVQGLVSEAEGRLVQMQQMTVIQELDKFMVEITVNAPEDQAAQLNQLVSSTKQTFSSAIESLERFIQRTDNIQRAYNKYKESAFTLSKALNETSETLQVISQHKDLSELSDQVDAIKSGRDMLNKMKSCLRNMKDAMAGIESLTLSVCDLGMDDYVKESHRKYKQRRAELSEALVRLETVQSQMEGFTTLHDKCEQNITDLNGALRQTTTDNREIDHMREQTDALNLNIQEMEGMVVALEKEGVHGTYSNRLAAIKASYVSLVDNLSAATSSSYHSAITALPLGSAKSSPRRSPRRQTPSDPGTPRQSLRKWLRAKTDELQDLMSQPFPFDDKNIQAFWHSIQKYQGDLVVKGEEFSLYTNEADGEQPTMDQITPLIDTCADLSYRLDAHARLCVQYTADQNGLLSELRSLEEAKGSLQHSEIPLRDQYRMCGDLLDQVTSLKRRVHEQLTNKLPAISINLAKKEGGSILSDTSELDAAVSKLKLEIKAFHQSLEASISNLDQLTKQLTELHAASSQLHGGEHNFTLSEPITCENVTEALNNCKRQLAALSDKQQYVNKLLSKRGVSIGRLPSQDDEQLEQVIAQSIDVTDDIVSKLEQHQSNLTSLHQTAERFEDRCGEAKESLASAELLLNKAVPTNVGEDEVVVETIETVTLQCKTRLHECVTCVEQAEIAVAELEQRNNGPGKVEQQKEIVKEIQAKHKTLSERLRELEQRMSVAADNQRSLESLMNKFDDWVETSKDTISDEISLTNQLTDMRDHIIKLHELEKSEEMAVCWITEMRKLGRALSQTMSPAEQSSLSQKISGKEAEFDEFRHTLASKIESVSKQMEVVIAWIQKSSDLTNRLNNMKHSMSDLSNTETNQDSIQSKLATLNSYISLAKELQSEFSALTSEVPPAVSEKQRKSTHNAQDSCATLLSDLVAMGNTLAQVDKVWCEYKHLSGEVKDHLRHCQSQMEAVKVPGVSLDARRERYEEICEALDHYPEGSSPAYLQELLSTCPVASPDLYSEAISIMDEHEALIAEARKGATKFAKELQVRSALETNLKTTSRRLKEMGERVHNSLLLEDWDVRSCDMVRKFLETEEVELKALYDQVYPMISSQKDQHSANEETMTLDFKESIEEFEDNHRELAAILVQEKEVLSLAREFCQYITDSVEVVDSWLSRTDKLSEDINNANLPSNVVEQELQSALDDVAGMRQHLARVNKYTEQVSDSLTPAARKRLSDLVISMTNSTNEREKCLTELLDHHGKLGQTKSLHNAQCQELEQLLESFTDRLSAVNSRRPSDLTDCQDKLEQIEAIEAEEADIQQSISSLYETTSALAKLLPNESKLHPHDKAAYSLTAKPSPSSDDSTQHEQKVKDLCVNRWSQVKAKLGQIKNDTSSTLKLLADVANRQQGIVGEEYQQVMADVTEAESLELESLPAAQLDMLEEKSRQNSAAISHLWQRFLSVKDLESSLASRLGGDGRKSSKMPEIGTHISNLASRCQKVEGRVEAASARCHSATNSLQKNLDEMRQLEADVKTCDPHAAGDMRATHERLQQLKGDVTKLYQTSNEVVSSYGPQLPPDVSNTMNSIQNINESLLEEIQERLGQTVEIMEQFNVVHIMQQDLENWLSNTMQAINSDVVDSQVALFQQRDLEEHIVKYNQKLSEFTNKTHDLEGSLDPKEGQRLLETVSHFQKSFSGIKQGVERRRSQVSQLVVEEENFQTDLTEVEEILSTLDALVRQEVTDANLETCELLANQYQNELKRIPQLDEKLNDLAALSIRLGDSSHNSNSTTKVLDLKKDWDTMKAQIAQQANSLKETTKLLLAAPPISITHEEWTANQKKMKAEAEDSLRDLHHKVDGSELIQTDQVMDQLKLYEAEEEKLKNLSSRIEELNNRKEQLQKASLDPLLLKDWATQVTKVDGELKQLYMKSEETVKRQGSIVDKANKLAAEGVKREQMENPIVPVPAPALDLSMDSDLCVEEVRAPLQSQRPSLYQDEQAARLFTVEKNPDTIEVEEKMNRMIDEQENLQTSIADVNRDISKCQWTLDQDYHTTEELRQCLHSIQRTKAQLGGLSKSESASQEPSLPVLAMSVETLELRCLSELQRLETNDSLNQDHRDTLDSIEEEVVACQKYLDYLDSMPGGAEEKLPGVEHKVSKLQRMFQTLQLINPTLCEGSLVSEYLGQLMNDLQMLQGRLEVIPEEGDFRNQEKELHSWQQHMADHVNQHKADSDTEFVDKVLSDLSASLRLLTPTDSHPHFARPQSDFLSAYKELLSAAEKGVNTGRLIDAEHVSDHRENLQKLFTLFNTYRLLLGNIDVSSASSELQQSLSDLSASTHSLQKDLWCQSEKSGRLKDLTTILYSHCDAMLKSLNLLMSEFRANKINQSRLERSLVLLEAEYHGLVSAATQHLSDFVRSPELREQLRSLQRVWFSLQELSNSASEPVDGFTQLFTDMMMSQRTNQNAPQQRLDLTVPLNICLPQALDLLVELDTFNWMYKDICSGKDDVDLEIKSSFLAVKPKMNAIKSSLQEKLREFSPSDTETICKVYTWLGDIKPFNKPLPAVTAIHEYIQELLSYQCNLSQRTYITGLMMSLVTSCDHDVIIRSQNAVKALHEAKVAASKQLSTAHSLRDSYRSYSKIKSSFDKWINEVNSLCKDCPIGSQHSVTWLLQKCQTLHTAGVELRAQRDVFVTETQTLSSREMCSQVAMREANRNVNELLNKQETSMLQLSSLADTLRSVHSDWIDFNRIYHEACDILDEKEHLLEIVPCLSPLNTIKEFQQHLSQLKVLMDEPERQTDRIQSLSHSLRINITVASTLQLLDQQTKSIKSREYTLYSQKLPLMIERWQGAELLLSRYNNSCSNAKELLREIKVKLQNTGEPTSLKELESSLSVHQQLLHKLECIDWGDVKRQADGVGKLTGISLSHCQHLQKLAEDQHTLLVELVAEGSQSSTALAHCAQSVHTLENKLARVERDPLLTSNSTTRLSYKTLLDRRLKTELLLTTLLSERNQLDTLHSQTTHTAKPAYRSIADSVSMLEGRFNHILSLIISRLSKLQEDINVEADVNEIQSSYQDWKNRAIRLTSLPISGEFKDLEDQRLKCLTLLNLADVVKLSVPRISKTSISTKDHNDLVKTLKDSEASFKALIHKNRLFNKLKEMIMYSLHQLDTKLSLRDKTYDSHVGFSNRIPQLKATFEQHQKTSLIMRQICQELLPHCDDSSRTKLLAVVQKSSSKWQSALSRLMAQSDESMTVISNAKSLNHSLISFAKDVGSVRQGTRGSLPEHHEHLQERQSQADVFDWRLEKINTKCSVMKFDLSSLSSQVDQLLELDLCFNISQALTEDSESIVAGLKHELNDKLSVWNSFISEVNATLVEMQRLEKLYMNEKRLTIEELLEEIKDKYSVELRKLSHKAEHLVSKGTALLSITGDLYGSAIQHGIVSLQSSMKHLTRLSSTRTSKLKDTMSAILDFEAGMKSLNQWLKTTEGSLKFTPADWHESTVLANHQYLVQLEKDISHHSRTVTAVINLCSLLQYDRDAGYDITVKQELSAVKDRLNSRWRKLCDKIISKKEQLYDLGQAWSQVRTQTSTLISKLLQYKEKCEDYVRSRSIRPKSHQLEEFSKILKECEAKHEDMRLLNNRLRYLTRNNMLDNSGCIKKAVARCTELWDSAYQSLSELVKDMRIAHETWTDFVKERDVLLAKVSHLSLILKTKPGSRENVEKKLAGYQTEVDSLLGEPVVNLRNSCTTEEHRKLDSLIQELTLSIATLRSELRPQDDLHVVEEELELAIHQTEDLEQDLESMNLDVQHSVTAPVSEVMSGQQAAETSSKVAEMERRVEKIAQRATIRRQLRPTINTLLDRNIRLSASSDSLNLDNSDGQDVTSTRASPRPASHQPVIRSPATALLQSRISRAHSAEGGRHSSRSGEMRRRLVEIALSSPLPLTTKNLHAFNQGLLPSTFKCDWLLQSRSRSAASAIEFDTNYTTSNKATPPFQKYMTARRRSLSQDRDQVRVGDKPPNRARSVSLEQSLTGERLSRGRTLSDRPRLSRPTTPKVPVLSLPNSPSPLPALSVDTQSTGYLLSAAPMMSSSTMSRRCQSPLSVRSSPASDSELSTISDRIQLQLDLRHILEWIDKLEVMYTSIWNADVPLDTDLNQLTSFCKQYNEILAQCQHYKPIRTSINLTADIPEKERNQLNSRWKEVGRYLESRQDTLVSALLVNGELKRLIDTFSDDVTHVELKLLGGTHSKESVQTEAKSLLTSIRSYISMFTSLLCEAGGRGKQLLDTLRACEIKCQNILL